MASLEAPVVARAVALVVAPVVAPVVPPELAEGATVPRVVDPLPLVVEPAVVTVTDDFAR